MRRPVDAAAGPSVADTTARSRWGDVGWALGLNLLNIAISGVSFLVMANLLGPQAYGVFALAFTLATFPPLLAGFGGDHVYIMHASRRPEESAALFGNALLVRALLSPLLLLILAGLAGVFGIAYVGVLLIVATAALLVGFAHPLFFSYYRVAGIVRFPWLMLAFGNFIFLVCLLALRPGSEDVRLIAWAYLLTQAAPLPILLFDVVRRVRPRVNPGLLRRHLRLGGYFSTSQLVDQLYARLDILLIQVLAGAMTVGLYSAGFRLVALLAAVPAAVHIIMLPDFHRAATQGTAALTTIFQQTRQVLANIAALFLGGVAATGPALAEVLFVPEYSPTGAIISISAIGMAMLYLSYSYSMLAEAQGRVGARLLLRCVATPVCALMIAAGIVLGGVYGAAAGVASGGVMFLLMLHWLTRDGNGGARALLEDAAPLLVAAVAALAVLGSTRVRPLPAALPLAAGLYLALFLGLGYVTGVVRLRFAAGTHWIRSRLLVIGDG